MGFWDEDEVVDEVDGKVAISGSYADEWAVAGFNFLDIGEGFLENLALRGEEDAGAFWADEGDGAVFEFCCGVAFCVDVGNFF